MTRVQFSFIPSSVLCVFLCATLPITARPAPGFPRLDGVHWALLVAGSNGWGNYRHQADVCHAYHVLKDGGLDDDHIVVMMYDDIASSPYNPVPGTIINRPGGPDMYAGVPKDYTGSQVSAANVLAVLSGNASALTDASNQCGPVGSGKVIASGPHDRVFVFYSDHGSPGILGMPMGQPFLMASDLIATLKEMSDRKAFQEMVMYIEACESGSIFEGLLPPDLNIYVATAANAEESSWATYCPGPGPVLPSGYDTCLGDLFSVAWMENSDALDLNGETLQQQFELVRDRTSNNGTFSMGSHAMQYGTLQIDGEEAAEYFGDQNTGQGDGGLYPVNTGGDDEDDNNGTKASIHGRKDSVSAASRPATKASAAATAGSRRSLGPAYPSHHGVQQRDAELLPLMQRYLAAPEGSRTKRAALRALDQELDERARVDDAIDELAVAVAAMAEGSSDFLQLAEVDIRAARPQGQPLVDDWSCFKQLLDGWQRKCGPLSAYGLRHSRVFANLCNAGVRGHHLALVLDELASCNVGEVTEHTGVEGIVKMATDV
eukprot:jgi/Mesvir1/20517/Mv12398-RA.1